MSPAQNQAFLTSLAIVFGWTDAASNNHGALRHNGTYYKFDDPHDVQPNGNGCNPLHLITGSSDTPIGAS
jgi:hypothetical protein